MTVLLILLILLLNLEIYLVKKGQDDFNMIVFDILNSIYCDKLSEFLKNSNVGVYAYKNGMKYQCKLKQISTEDDDYAFTIETPEFLR